MDWEITAHVEAFLRAAGGTMRAQPLDHTVLLTAAESVRTRGPDAFGGDPPLFGWWREGADVTGVFLHTPPYPLLLGAAPAESMPGLAAALAERALPGVNGPAGLAEAFAQARGGGATVARRDRLYRLEALAEPADPPQGRAVVATGEHRPRVIEWYTAFADEIGEPARAVEGVVDDRLSHAGLMVWETPAGEPVAFAGITRQLAGMMRVAPVYTPPEHRGRGIAAALTAAVCRAALDAGARDVLLFADLANQTSNRLYQRIGFRPAADRTQLAF